MNWIYLNKNNSDEYMEQFAQGSGAVTTPLETWDYDSSHDPVVLRGIMKHKIIKRCWQDKRAFRYMDSGYFGNRPSVANPQGWKYWHRIVPNDLQHDHVVSCSSDRWQRLGIRLLPRQRGRNIMIVAPDQKPCTFYGIDSEQWLSSTIATITSLTDRPIQLRSRAASRLLRKTNTLEDVHAVVTYNSVAATEAVIAGVPAFVLAPCNAARPVANLALAQIDDPWFPDLDQRQAWVHHLAYGQFHIDELRDGTASRLLQSKEA